MKPYYSDRIKSEWMGREFGVKVIYMLESDRDYIHLESYDIFQPQIFDVVKKDINVAIVSPDHHEYRYADYITLTQLKSWGDVEIIQRNGKAFFTPEEDEIK